MPDQKDDIQNLIAEFNRCENVLFALGNETRQHLMLEMMRIGNCNGVRVGEITRATNLSRPTVSHHIEILKEAGIVKMRREGTKNYYYFDADARVMNDLLTMVQHAICVMEHLPDRTRETW